jgi:hypothetical protein
VLYLPESQALAAATVVTVGVFSFGFVVFTAGANCGGVLLGLCFRKIS